MRRDRLMMFGAITALTFSLIWAASLLPGGAPGIPGLLSIGSLVENPPGPVNFDAPSEKRCKYDVRAEMIREETRRTRHQTRNIRISVERALDTARQHKIVVQRKHKHQHRQIHKRERRRCRSMLVPARPTMPIPPVPPIPPLAPLAPLAPPAAPSP